MSFCENFVRGLENVTFLYELSCEETEKFENKDNSTALSGIESEI